jgi:hypothetical protein
MVRKRSARRVFLRDHSPEETQSTLPRCWISGEPHGIERRDWFRICQAAQLVESLVRYCLLLPAWASSHFPVPTRSSPDCGFRTLRMMRAWRTPEKRGPVADIIHRGLGAAHRKCSWSGDSRCVVDLSRLQQAGCSCLGPETRYHSRMAPKACAEI